jgi:hypothetical protein
VSQDLSRVQAALAAAAAHHGQADPTQAHILTATPILASGPHTPLQWLHFLMAAGPVAEQALEQFAAEWQKAGSA